VAAVAATLKDLEDLAEQRHRDPGAVVLGARACLNAELPVEVEAAARWVLGLALHELGRMGEAIESFQLSIETSMDLRLRDYEAKARGALAISLLSLGEASRAAEQIALARAVATPSTEGVVEMLGGLVMQRTGHLVEAQASYTRALRRLTDQGDLSSVARLRLNRGILRAYRGDGSGAVEDLSAAEDLAAAQALPVLQAMASHNLGFAYGRRGDVAGALTAFARAEQAYSEIGRPVSLTAILEADRCEVLLSAGLIPEAGQAARTAVAALEDSDDEAYSAECQLLLARALLASGAYPEANSQAVTVAFRFHQAGREPWAALANYVAIQSEFLAHPDLRSTAPGGLLGRCQSVARALEAHGWAVEAAHVRTFVGRLAMAQGFPEVARAELSGARNARRRGSAHLRAEAWHAMALLHVAEGNPGAARRAISNGLRIVEDHLATLGPAELRARGAGHGDELARLGVRLALADGKPAEVLRWSERWRAESMRQPPLRPPDDAILSSALADFRRVRSELRQAALDGKATARLQRQAMAAEGAVRQRLLNSASARGGLGRRPEISAIRSALGSVSLIEYVDVDGELFAVTVWKGRSHLFALGALAAVEAEQAHLLFALKRSLRPDEGEPWRELVEVAAARLDELLLAPLGLEDDAQAVVVPTGSLLNLPWGCLPSLAGRAFTVAPSAAICASRSREGCGEQGVGVGFEPRVILVAGPGLPGAEEEVSRLAGLYPAARTFTGPEASVGKVLGALREADVLHLAAHGTYRADSPMFSSFLLADGPLTVHDLDSSRSTVKTVILASCEAGVSGTISGEVIGTASVLLGLGARTVVAPVVSIPDAPTAELMVGFHRRLIAGSSPGVALAAMRAASGLERRSLACVFVSIGSDQVMGEGPRSQQ
jgi:tetratricopeptide (TPR) repeat protein